MRWPTFAPTHSLFASPTHFPPHHHRHRGDREGVVCPELLAGLKGHQPHNKVIHQLLPPSTFPPSPTKQMTPALSKGTTTAATAAAGAGRKGCLAQAFGKMSTACPDQVSAEWV